MAKKYAAAMILLLAAPLVSAPPPRLLREIDLNSIIPAGPAFTPFATISFSPDENWAAVAVGARQSDPRKTTRNIGQGSETLLLIPLHGSADQTVRICLGLRPTGSPAWSPDSTAILVQGFAYGPPNSSIGGVAKLWDLRGNELLRHSGPGLSEDGPVGGVFGFLDSKHFLARRIAAKGSPAAFETLDLQGRVVDTWMAPHHWTVADISPERGLLAVLSENASKTLIVDYASKKVVLARGNPHGYLGRQGGAWQFFTEGGKTLCSVGSVGKGNPQFDTATDCWDIDSGSRIAQFGGFLGGAPAAASSHGARLVLTSDRAFPGRNEALVFPHGERVVWDFRSGADIAVWGAPQIAWARGAGSHTFDSVAISASGRYAAETTHTLFRIYELP